MLGSMEIRRFTRRDREACLDLLTANAPQHFAARERPEFAAYLDAGPAYHLVAVEQGRVYACGGIETFPSRGEAEFRWIMAAPQVQGQGVGKQLMLASIRHLLETTSIRRILVYTTPGSAGFFRKLGLPAETLRTEEHYWAPGLHLELLSLTLDEREVQAPA